ncbi:MAG: hypothetical protein JO002_10340 [Burkholderiaceae bacterium]|nr:hypothetical protein [Burkholderiaceae bacterium]
MRKSRTGNRPSRTGKCRRNQPKAANLAGRKIIFRKCEAKSRAARWNMLRKCNEESNRKSVLNRKRSLRDKRTTKSRMSAKKNGSSRRL